MSSEIKAKKTYVRDNPDGSPYFNYDFTNVLNVETHAALLTGPITGLVVTEDGTEYNVTDGAIGVQLEHLDEVNAKIKAHHNAEGRFLDYGDVTAETPLKVESPADDEE
jgi:hypothetical protein